MNATFDAALAAFLKYANELQAGQYDGKLPDDTITADAGGKKYLRIVRNNYGDPKSRSAFCFIEIATGNVLKADGWKAPAKGVRGSIYTPENYGITKYGALYNR